MTIKIGDSIPLVSKLSQNACTKQCSIFHTFSHQNFDTKHFREGWKGDNKVVTCDKAVAMYFPPAAPITIFTFPLSSKIMDGDASDMGLLRGFKESTSS